MSCPVSRSTRWRHPTVAPRCSRDFHTPASAACLPGHPHPSCPAMPSGGLSRTGAPDADSAAAPLDHAPGQLPVVHVDPLAEADQDLRAAFAVPAAFWTCKGREVLKTSGKFFVPAPDDPDTQDAAVRGRTLRRLAQRAGPDADLEEGN